MRLSPNTAKDLSSESEDELAGRMECTCRILISSDIDTLHSPVLAAMSTLCMPLVQSQDEVLLQHTKSIPEDARA